MNIRNEIKSHIAKEGCTMSQVVEALAERYHWNPNISGLSGKLLRGSIRYQEAIEIADILGYDIVWQKRTPACR